MTWGPAEAEGLAMSVYRMARLEPDDMPGPRALARALGVRILTAPRGGAWGQGELTKVKGEPVVFLSARVPQRERGYVICHELCEHALKVEGYAGEDVEVLANAAAAAVLAPRGVFRLALRKSGPTYPALADAFGCTESLVALRMGEVTGIPMALVAPTSVRVRGEPWGWPPANDIRRMARADVLPFQLARVRLTDDAKRVVLRATG